jgi:hypothetical protein
MGLEELLVGDQYEGVVITVTEFGAYVDFGANKDGYVRLRVRGGLVPRTRMHACLPGPPVAALWIVSRCRLPSLP